MLARPKEFYESFILKCFKDFRLKLGILKTLFNLDSWHCAKCLESPESEAHSAFLIIESGTALII